MTSEDKARDLLERMGFETAHSMSAGDVGELAQLISDVDATRALLKSLEANIKDTKRRLAELEKSYWERMPLD